jgi:hypothetical protein
VAYLVLDTFTQFGKRLTKPVRHKEWIVAKPALAARRQIDANKLADAEATLHLVHRTAIPGTGRP